MQVGSHVKMQVGSPTGAVGRVSNSNLHPQCEWNVLNGTYSEIEF